MTVTETTRSFRSRESYPFKPMRPFKPFPELTVRESFQVLKHQAFVYHVVKRLYKTTGIVHWIPDQEDAVQLGFLALIRCVRGYQPAHKSKAKFMSYAAVAIERKLMDEATNTTIHVPKKMLYRLGRHNRGLSGGMTAKEAAMVNRARNCRAFVDEALPGSVVDHRQPRQSWEPELLEAVASLPEKEWELVVEKYGLLGHDPHTLKELGTVRGVTRERIRQRLLVILAKIRVELAGNT